jgi:hypothetical protein
MNFSLRIATIRIFAVMAVILAPGFMRWAEASGTAANQGFAGIWEYPSAEMPEDGSGRIGYTNASPYNFYYADLTWLPWLEVNARFATFDNIYAAPDGGVNVSGRGRDYMDKAFDVKAMLHGSRGGYLPSVALGMTDIMGTELSKALYGVATWRAGRFAFSAGYGTERMNGFFAGASLRVADWLELKAEYSPMDYAGDVISGFRPHADAADSKYNFGVVFEAPWGTQGAVSWQRGERFVFSLSQAFGMDGPFFRGSGTRRGRAFEAPGASRVAEWEDIDAELLCGNIVEALSRYARVRDVEVAVGEGKILVAYENYGHSSQAEAMVRVMVVLAAVSPHLDEVRLVPRERGIPVVSATFPGNALYSIRARNFSLEGALESAAFEWAGPDCLEAGDGGWLFQSGASLRERAKRDLKAMVVFEPRIDQTLDDDYQNRWNVDLIYERRSSSGWGAYMDVRVPVFNDVDIWWEPDMNDHVRIHRAVVSYLAKVGDEESGLPLWLLSEAGWLDENWFGASQWARVYSRNGRLWGGSRIGVVRDRDPLSFAGLPEGRVDYGWTWFYDDDAEPWQPAWWLEAGYTFSDLNLDVQANYGRFIDSDVGAKISLVRRWDDSAVGFWVSRTERLSPDKDFTAAGVHLELPAERWFGDWFGNSSAHVWEQEVPLLSLWRIDAGREPGSWKNPDRLLAQLRPGELKRNVEKILEEYCGFGLAEPEGQKIRGLTDYIVRN